MLIFRIQAPLLFYKSGRGVEVLGFSATVEDSPWRADSLRRKGFQGSRSKRLSLDTSKLRLA